MCLYLFPPRPKKHRPSASYFEDPRPSKRRRTYQRIPSSSSSEASSPVRYEPLRGHGLRPESRLVTAVPVSGVLRGRGTKRDPPITSLHGNGIKRTSSRRSSERPVIREPVMMSTKRRSSSTRESRPSEMRTRPQYVPAVPQAFPDYYQQLSQSARGHPLRHAQPSIAQTYRTRPDDYFSYLDISTVRAATNQALQATIYETTRPARTSVRRDLRRRPARNCLQC
ncbi:hypothetical protein BT63DRAFT_89747 [Microthyrium microscopicum]|uniref:Uncharacterized protein n=1 Tax=Microthyrium microscopicum TaxID=703497 RepID=A0A6A6TXI7_9PEZI|nr:hypothetical protein BT63DRAFT_89747 [Microthyrium microscopicum]